MKKLILLAMATGLILSACSSNNTTSSSQEASLDSSSSKGQYVVSEDKEKQSKILLEDMVAGNFLSVEQCMAPELLTELSIDMLKTVFSQILTGEEFKGIVKTSSMAADDMTNVIVVSELSTKMLAFNSNYDKDGKITGIYFNFVPLEPAPVDNEILTEKVITVGAEELELNGMLTLPKGVTNPPVVVLVQGSGSHGMDSSVGSGGNKPFKDIAHGLAAQGIASIRYDKRYYSHPQMAAEGVTINKEVLDDVSAAIDFVVSTGEIDKDNVFILGHSMGGMLAPKISIDNPEIKGFISMAGSPRFLEDIIYDQNMQVLKNNGLPNEQIEQIILPLKEEIAKIKELKEDSPKATLITMDSGYWYSLSQATGDKVATSFTCPAFIIQGSADFQVDETADFKYWQELLKGNNKAEFKLYENLNHLFMASNGTGTTEEYNIPSNVDENVILDISNWIKKQTV